MTDLFNNDIDIPEMTRKQKRFKNLTVKEMANLKINCQN